MPATVEGRMEEYRGMAGAGSDSESGGSGYGYGQPDIGALLAAMMKKMNEQEEKRDMQE